MTVSAPDRRARSAPARPAANRAERLLLPATFITSLGNGIQLVASAVLVFTTGGTALSVGWLYIAVAVPPALLSLWFGAVADRFDRRTLCLIADLAAAAAAMVLPVWLLLGGEPNPTAYATSFTLAAIAAMFMPASNALIKERVDPGRVTRFSAHYEMALQSGLFVSAALGGFAIHLVGTTPLFMFNGVTFLASAAAMVAIGRAPTRPDASEPTTDPTGTREAPLVRLGLLYAICNVMTTVSNTALIVLVYDGFGRGAGVYGLADALAGVGFMAAAAVYPRIGERLGHLRTAVLGIVGCGLLCFLLPQHLWILLGAIAIPAAMIGLARVASRTLLLRAVPESRAGRVFGAANAAGLGISAGLTIVIAVIADRTDVANAWYVLGSFCAVVALATAATMRRVGAARS